MARTPSLYHFAMFITVTNTGEEQLREGRTSGPQFREGRTSGPWFWRRRSTAVWLNGSSRPTITVPSGCSAMAVKKQKPEGKWGDKDESLVTYFFQSAPTSYFVLPSDTSIRTSISQWISPWICSWPNHFAVIRAISSGPKLPYVSLWGIPHTQTVLPDAQHKEDLLLLRYSVSVEHPWYCLGTAWSPNWRFSVVGPYLIVFCSP